MSARVEPELEPEPEVALEIFGDRIERARAFARALAEEGEVRGLIGPLEPARLWTRHILNCAVVGSILRPGVVGDVGSGAGLPGLVLAIARPDVSFVLIEPMERRVAWLGEQVESLRLDNVRVIRARAEEVKLEERFDQVTARAVSSLRKLVPLVVPLVKAGGELVLMKGANAEAEIEAAQKEIRRFHLREVAVMALGVGVLDETTRVVCATRG